MEKPSIHKNLIKWYKENGRVGLPWRNTRDPYHIWLSEVMLQQTQVSTVLARYYHPFLELFPTIQALAAAPLQDVLKAWEGLGYYTRARNLHKAAQHIATNGCIFPSSVEALVALPGIGKNTAHAIAAFAFHQPVSVMEANVKRVLCRLHGITHPTDAQLWQHAQALLDTKNPFDYNQAMMDIGALVCTKSSPQCDACPLTSACVGKDNPTAYPAPKKAARERVRERIIVAFHTPDNRYYLSPRTRNFLHGLYGFPEFEPATPLHFINHSYATDTLQQLGKITQVYSHFTLRATVYRHTVQHADLPEGGWFSLQQIEALPLSRADSKVLKLIM